MTKTILIEKCDMLRFEGGQPKFTFQQDILVRGDRIHAIGSTGSLDFPPGTKIVPARGMLAVPGMVNAHAHVPMVLLRGVAEDVTIEEWFNDYILDRKSVV